MDLDNFLRMGGYAFYVWTAYGLAAVILVANLVIALRRGKQVTRMIERYTKQLMGTR